MKKKIIMGFCMISLMACKGIQQSDEEIIKQYLEEAEVYVQQGENDFAELSFASAIEISKNIYGEESKEVADLYLELADCNNTFEEALDSMSFAENIFRKQDSAEGLARAYYSYGIIYKKKSEYELAQKAFEDASEYCDLLKEDMSQLKFDIYLSLSGLESMSAEESLDYALEAEKLVEKITDVQKTRLYISMGNTYYNLGMAEESANKYEKALGLWESLKSTKYMEKEEFKIAQTYALCGHCYTSIGRPEKGIEYINRSLEILNEMKGATLWEFARAYRLLSVAYTSEDTLNKEKALEYGMMSCKEYLKQERELSNEELDQLNLLKDCFRELYEVNLHITEQDFETWYNENVVK